jgi:hypothetical protein
VDGECLVAGMVAWDRSFQGGEKMWTEEGVDENLAEVGGSAEVEEFFGNCGWWGLRRGCGNFL